MDFFITEIVAYFLSRSKVFIPAEIKISNDDFQNKQTIFLPYFLIHLPMCHTKFLLSK